MERSIPVAKVASVSTIGDSGYFGNDRQCNGVGSIASEIESDWPKDILAQGRNMRISSFQLREHSLCARSRTEKSDVRDVALEKRFEVLEITRVVVRHDNCGGIRCQLD